MKLKFKKNFIYEGGIIKMGDEKFIPNGVIDLQKDINDMEDFFYNAMRIRLIEKSRVYAGKLYWRNMSPAALENILMEQIQELNYWLNSKNDKFIRKLIRKKLTDVAVMCNFLFHKYNDDIYAADHPDLNCKCEIEPHIVYDKKKVIDELNKLQDDKLRGRGIK